MLFRFSSDTVMRGLPSIFNLGFSLGVIAILAPKVQAQASAQDSAALVMTEQTALSRKPFSAASSQTIRDRDFETRVMLKPSDLLKVTPGLFTGQHSGGGKANQYFLRGFDIDHGTDLALWVDHLPVNMVSHAHGQGYADLHFIIPELFQRVEVNKGPYSVEYGDFATAGAVRMVTRDHFDESYASLQAGMFQDYRFVGRWSAGDTLLKPTLAAEIARNDGPFDSPENLERYNLFARSKLWRSEAASLDLTFMGYGSSWQGSGQVPERAVKSGLISRWGHIDPSEGGNSLRHSLSFRLHNGESAGETQDEWNLSAYAMQYRLNLYSNFTFYAADSVNGDEIEQVDDRLVTGFRADSRRQRKLLGMPAETYLGVEWRSDRIENGLYRDVRRTRIGATVQDKVTESSLGIFLQEEMQVLPWLCAQIGSRADYFSFGVNDPLETLSDSAAKSSGARSASIFSPKGNLIVGPFYRTEFYLNSGYGFHSNDSRGVVAGSDPVTPLSQALGYEVGMRTALLPRVEVAASLWALDLASELVWVGDEGRTEARPATERRGVDLEARATLLSWLFADVDLTWAKAVYVENAGNGDAVALAPTFTLAGGISAVHLSGFKGSLRLHHLADRPATEDESLTAEGFTVVDVAAIYRWRQVEFSLDIANVFNTDWREAQFENESRLQSEAEAVTDIHYVPGHPLTLRSGAKLFF